MKVLLQKYPKGSFKSQKTDGRYIDGFLYQNLKLLATKIVDDMTFLVVVFSSTLEVGTGKSVLLSQIGEVWTEIIKEVHDIDVPFTMNNIVFRPEELVARAFKVPKYSFIQLDEWEDAHYWSKLGMTLRQFFRKCRQLNLIIGVIIPNFFQLPLNYAIGRSIFAIDVKFDEHLNRGNYDFYGFKSKKMLYIKGKKFQDYSAHQSDFSGEFFDGYGVPDAEYRRTKLRDMLTYDDDKTPEVKEYDIECQLLQKIYKNLPKISQTQLADALGKSQQTISRMILRDLGTINATVEIPLPTTNPYIKIQPKNKINFDGLNEEELPK